MGAKLILLVGVSAIGIFCYRQASTWDPTIFPYNKAQVEALLAKGRSDYVTMHNENSAIWHEGTSERGVMLKRQTQGYDKSLSCEAVITPIDAQHTRVKADCAKEYDDTTDPIEGYTKKLYELAFDEHIAATIERRPFNATMLSDRQTALTLAAMPSMQREALRRQDEMQDIVDASADNSQ